MDFAQFVEMLKPDLVKCSSCQSILDVLCSIDEKLAKIANTHYNNIAYGLNRNYSKTLTQTIIRYRRIMNSKLFNPSYTTYTQSQLISRVKQLINA